jgi:hypothetical protein
VRRARRQRDGITRAQRVRCAAAQLPSMTMIMASCGVECSRSSAPASKESSVSAPLKGTAGPARPANGSSARVATPPGLTGSSGWAGGQHAAAACSRRLGHGGDLARVCAAAGEQRRGAIRLLEARAQQHEE